MTPGAPCGVERDTYRWPIGVEKPACESWICSRQIYFARVCSREFTVLRAIDGYCRLLSCHRSATVLLAAKRDAYVRDNLTGINANEKIRQIASRKWAVTIDQFLLH